MTVLVMNYDINIFSLKSGCLMMEGILSLKSSLLWRTLWFRHCMINMTPVIWRTRFRHQFVTKNILWWFSYILWQICFIIYVTFSTSESASQYRNSPETLVVLVGLPSWTADGPPLGRGQSAVHFISKYSSYIVGLHSIISYAFM